MLEKLEYIKIKKDSAVRRCPFLPIFGRKNFVSIFCYNFGYQNRTAGLASGGTGNGVSDIINIETNHIVVSTVFLCQLIVVVIQSHGTFLQSGCGQHLIICVRMKFALNTVSDHNNEFFFFDSNKCATGKEHGNQSEQDDDAKNILSH